MFFRNVQKKTSINVGVNVEGMQLYSKETPTQMFFCEYSEIFKNSFFIEHLQLLFCSLKVFYPTLVVSF